MGIQIFDRAKQGRRSGIESTERITDTLAVQIYNLNVILDLDVVAIGRGSQ